MPVAADTLSAGRKAGYYLADLALRGLIGAAMAVPYRWRVPMMGWVVSRIAAPLAGLRRRIRGNLALARPDLGRADVERLCRSVPDNAGRTLIEFYSGEEFLERARAAPLTGDGVEDFLEARAAGRPVIFMSGHFGNYDAARAKLFSMGHPMGAIYRRMANPYFNTHYERAIKSVGEPMFEQGRRGMTHMVRHLKDGGIIAIAGDLFVQGGEELRFFGQPAVTSIVPAELALRYGAAIFPLFGIRKENGLDFEVFMQKEIPHSDPLTMTQAINDGLETLVRAHMDQWFWVHRRWKPWLDRGLAAGALED